MLVLIFFQYISLLLMPFSSGLSLIFPSISLLVIYFVLFKDFKNLDLIVKGHLVGQMLIGLTTVAFVISMVLTFGITQEMKQLSVSQKEIAGSTIMLMGIAVFLRYYYVLCVNFVLFRKRLPFEKRLPLPLTKSRYDFLKTLLKQTASEESNILFKKEGDA